MRKIFLVLLFGVSFNSCVPVKEIISDNYKLDNDTVFKILQYSEPKVGGIGITTSNDNKFAVLNIVMSNKGPEMKKIDFKSFFIGGDKIEKIQILRVNRAIEVGGTMNQSVEFKAWETKKLWLQYIVPKEEEITHLIFNGKKVELKFEQTK